MKSKYVLNKFMVGVFFMLLSFGVTAQQGRDRINLEVTAPAGTVSGDRLPVSVTANDPVLGSNNGDGINRVVIQLLDADTRRVVAAEIFRSQRGRPIRPPFNANFDIASLTRVRSELDVILRVRAIGTARVNGQRVRTVFTRPLTLNNSVPAPGLPPQGTPTTVEEEINRINVLLTVENGAAGTFDATVVTSDPAVGFGSGNGDGITDITIRVLDANTRSILSGVDFTRGGSSGGFQFLAPPPYTGNFRADRITGANLTTRDVIIQARVEGFVQNSQIEPGRRIQPITVEEQRFTVGRSGILNSNPAPAATFDPSVSGQDTPTTLEEELNRIVALFSVEEGAVVSGDFSATVVASDPLAGRGSGNGDGITDIEIALVDANTGEGLLGVDFTRGGSNGGFQFLAPPPYTAEFDTRRVTRPSQPIREVIVRANIEGFVQNSRIDPSQRIQPITVIERRITIDNSAAFSGQVDTNIPRGFAPDISGVFTFEVTGPNIASVDFEVEGELPGVINVSGRDTQAPFTFEVDFTNVEEERAFFFATVRLTDGSVQRITRRFTIASGNTVQNGSDFSVINVSDGIIEIQSQEPVRIMTLSTLEPRVVMRKNFSRKNNVERFEVPTSLNGVYIININGESKTTFIK